MPNRTNWTYIEHLKDHIEVLPPRGDLISITSREEESKDEVSFTPLRDLSLDVSQSPAMKASAIGTFITHTTEGTYAVNFSIALIRGLSRASGCSPCNLP